MFGQPASSHTVCRSRSRISRFVRAEAGAEIGAHPHPLRTACRGLGASGDSGLGEPPEQAHGSAHVRGIEGERREVVGALAPHDVLAFHLALGEVRGEPFDDRIHDDVEVGRGAEHLRERRDAAIGDAAGDDVVEHPEIGIDVERESVPGTATGDLHPDGGDLLVSHPDARVARFAAAPRRRTRRARR